MEEFDGFLIRMQTLDEVITDFTPPVFDRVIRQYPKKFHHKPIDEALKEHKLHVSEASPSFSSQEETTEATKDPKGWFHTSISQGFRQSSVQR